MPSDIATLGYSGSAGPIDSAENVATLGNIPAGSWVAPSPSGVPPCPTHARSPVARDESRLQGACFAVCSPIRQRLPSAPFGRRPIMSRILVLYGTTDGHTAKVARSLAETLRCQGAGVVVYGARLVDGTPDDYDGVIVAASV